MLVGENIEKRLLKLESYLLLCFTHIHRSDFICLFIYNFTPNSSSTHLSRLLHRRTSELTRHILTEAEEEGRPLTPVFKRMQAQELESRSWRRTHVAPPPSVFSLLLGVPGSVFGVEGEDEFVQGEREFVGKGKDDEAPLPDVQHARQSHSRDVRDDAAGQIVRHISPMRSLMWTMRTRMFLGC